jgi:hypothetical protein
VRPQELVADPSGGVRLACALAPGEPTITTEYGDDPPDDRLEMVLSASGLLQSKQFFRQAKPTAHIAYGLYKEHNGFWLADRVFLRHAQVDYQVELMLVAAKVSRDSDAP